MVLFIAFDYHRIDGEEVMKNMIFFSTVTKFKNENNVSSAKPT